MAGEMTFKQAATLLNSIQQQATGQAALVATDIHSFISCATTTLATGYDPVINAINQVLTRTIFSTRPYSRKFKGLEKTESQWGNHVRKLSIADKPVSDDDRHKWPVAYDATQTDNPLGNGQSVDQDVINKPEILQTNFYGANVWEDWYTIFKDQLDNAFTGPDQLGSFMGMVAGNMSDKLENIRENISRAALANFIGGVVDEAQEGRVVHLLTEYEAATGLKFATPQEVYQPANYKAFIQWAYARIAQISDMMTERTELFQTVVNGKHVIRHTPKAMQRAFLYAPARHQMNMMAIADTYHDGLLTMPETETVNFWQSAETPDSINMTVARIGANGAVTASPQAIEQAGIFGVIIDTEAVGVANTQSWSNPSPFNARGGYTNIWMHETQRIYNDHTEKGVVLLLD